MDLEVMFLNYFCIGKKPDIFELIQAAITVGEWKYPTEYKKHKYDIMKWLMNPKVSTQEYESDEDDSSVEVEHMEAVVPEKSPIFDDQRQKEKTNSTLTTEEQSLDKPDNDNLGKNMNTTVRAMSKSCCKIKLSIKKHKQLDDSGQKGTKQAQINNLQTATTTTVNLKSATNGVMRKSGKGLIKKTDIHAEAQSKNMQTTTVNMKSATNGVMRKSGKVFKKMDNDADAQSKSVQTTTVNMKSATKVDCRGVMGKSSKGFKKTDIDADAQSKNTVTTLTATTKHCTEEIVMNKKRSRVDFESSKRKYEDRVAEQNKAKRRTIMVDFYEMPKPAKDPCVPKRCWERRRF